VKPALASAALVVATGVLGLALLPVLVAVVVAGQLQQAAAQAATWDIPSAVLPALEEAGQQAGIPWFLLAGVASVATNFAQDAPDGIPRGAAVGTAIFPVVTPPVGHPGVGQGMFLLAPGPGDPQDVRASADWLAALLAALSQGSPLAQQPLASPGASQFWQSVLARAPLAILAPASDGPPAPPASPGTNPIQQFGSAVMARISAPITASNLGAFSAWAAGEGTCARYNPLATTQPEAGATPFNNLSGGGHVWDYPSFAVGVQATTTALTNGLYQPVIAAFQADAGVNAVAAAVERSPWGTHHFGSTAYAGVACSNDGSGSAAPPTLPTVTGPAAVPATIMARALQYQQTWQQMNVLASVSSSTLP